MPPSGYNEEELKFETPSLAKRIGESLEKCAIILKREAIVSGDDKTRDKVNAFLEVHRIDWSKKVSAKATLCLRENRYNKPVQLPDKEDVVKMAQYLSEVGDSTFQQLSEDPTNAKLFNRLVMITLTVVIVFNRKRPGDAHKLWVDNFEKAVSYTNTHTDIYNSLNDEQKELIRIMKRIEESGKQAMKVPILLSPRMQSALALLVKVRNQCGVPKSNKFLFAGVGTTKFIRGSSTKT